MLGHSDIRTTRIYAQITDNKVSTEMKMLEEKIKENYKTEVDKKFETLSIEQQMRLFNLDMNILNIEPLEAIKERTKSFWYGLNKEIKNALINGTFR